VIDIFSNRKFARNRDREDDPFATDYLMQVDNRHATITADDEYVDYSDPERRRRNKTRAPQLFKILDNHRALLGRAMDSESQLAQLAMDHGTSPDLARKYNAGNQTDRDRIGVTVPAALYTGQTPGDRSGLATVEVPFSAVGRDAGAFLCFY
jgi:hypothetical protein